MTNITVKDYLEKVLGVPLDTPAYNGNYPLQIAHAAERKNGAAVMFSVDDFLCFPAMGDDRRPPLCDTSLSRFVLTINDGNVVKANLPASEVHALAVRCRSCVNAKIMKEALGMNSQAQAEDEPVKLYILAEFKGKTPEEILLADPANAAKLQQAVPMLQKNIADPRYAKYAASNQKAVNAITKALQKQQNGTLKPVSASCIDVYKGEWKNTGKLLEGGKSKIYKLDIRCYMSGKSPWEVTISEGIAPLERKEDNTQIIRLSQMEQLVTKTMHMGTVWETIAEKMDSVLSSFEQTAYPLLKLYAERNTYFEKQKQKTGNGQSPAPQQNQNGCSRQPRGTNQSQQPASQSRPAQHAAQSAPRQNQPAAAPAAKSPQPNTRQLPKNKQNPPANKVIAVSFASDMRKIGDDLYSAMVQCGGKKFHMYFPAIRMDLSMMQSMAKNRAMLSCLYQEVPYQNQKLCYFVGAA